MELQTLGILSIGFWIILLVKYLNDFSVFSVYFTAYFVIRWWMASIDAVKRRIFCIFPSVFLHGFFINETQMQNCKKIIVIASDFFFFHKIIFLRHKIDIRDYTKSLFFERVYVFFCLRHAIFHLISTVLWFSSFGITISRVVFWDDMTLEKFKKINLSFILIC